MLITLASLYVSVYIEAGKFISMLNKSYAGKSNWLVPILYALFVALFLNLAFNTTCQAQCISTTAHSGTQYTSDNSIGSIPFNNPNQVGVSDNTYAAANATAIVFSGNTQYLKITGFNFSVPYNAIICGVTMTMECFATGISLFTSVKDNSVMLVKNNIVTGASQAKGSNWPTVEVQPTYGSANGLWGAFLTPQDVNSAQFGIAISTQINGLATLFPGVRIDYVSMTVYYSLPDVLPLLISEFKTTAHNNIVSNTWNITTQEDAAELTLERSINGHKWKPVQQYKNPRLGHNKHTETLTKRGTYHYRLQIKAADQSIRLSETNRIAYDQENTIQIRPNPASDFLFIYNAGKEPLHVYNTRGQQLKVTTSRSYGNVQVDLRMLQPGFYVLRAGNKTQTFLKQ